MGGVDKSRLSTIACWLEGSAVHPSARFDMSRNAIRFDDVFSGDRPTPVEIMMSSGVACDIAGASVLFFGNVLTVGSWICGIPASPEINRQARVILGLDEETAARLFHPDRISGRRRSEYTRAWAARTIRRLISTGVVDWEATRGDEI